MSDMPELDKYHAHEALDRTYIMLDYMMPTLLDHPFIAQNPGLFAIAEKAEAALGDLYRECGRVEGEMFPDD